MIFEFSAGGIVYKLKNSKEKNPSKIERNDILWLVCQHSEHKGWVFPKGLIGDKKRGENIEDAALRETEEEGGVKAKIIERIPYPIEYFYKKDNQLRKKTVYYFLMQYLSGDPKNHDDEMIEAKFVSEEEILKLLTYKNDVNAFKRALNLLFK